MKPYKDKHLAFLDCETTGLLVNDHEIIEIGVIIYDHQNDKVIEEWEVKCAPQHIETASQEALKINGFEKNANLYTKNIKQAIIRLNNMMENCIPAGQNVPFDVAFVNKYLKEFGIDPKFDRRYVEISSIAWAVLYNQNLNGLSLNDFCNHFNISNVGAHGALTDCKRALSVYKCLISSCK